MFGRKEEAQNGPEITDVPKQKKPIFKKWWFWVIVVVVVIFALPNGKSSTPAPVTSTPQAAQSAEAEPAVSQPAESTVPDPEANAEPSMTMGQQNALSSAKDYLDYAAFSHAGLVEQLEYEQYSHEDAVYAADNCGADWNVQAEKSAADYLALTSFSKNELIEQLEYEGYTHEQAVHGAEANGY